MSALCIAKIAGSLACGREHEAVDAARRASDRATGADYGRTFDALLGAQMLAGYLTAASFSTLVGDTDRTIDRTDGCTWTRATLRAMRQDCLDFVGTLGEADTMSIINEIGAECMGEFFWFTAQRHGVGFWEYPGPVFARATNIAHAYARDLIVGRRGAVHA